ncbi:MAG: aminopeptidase P family protein [Chloroflexi bacterium]|nr:aminopeptidase P family protein [Chloroflexota bacterium]
MEKASEIGERALGALAQYVKSGVTSRSAAAYFVWAMLENGSTEAPFLLWDAGPQVVHGVWQPGDHFLRPGDVIVTELSALVCGYGAQFQRPMAVGYVRQVYARLFEAAAASYWEGLEILRPGVTFGELTQAMARPIGRAGFMTVTPYYHGFGLGLEYPVSFSGSRLKRSSLATPTVQKQLEQDQVRPGMVLALEPNAVTPDDSHGVHVGDTVVVTEHGARRLSRIPLEWIIV